MEHERYSKNELIGRMNVIFLSEVYEYVYKHTDHFFLKSRCVQLFYFTLCYLFNFYKPARLNFRDVLFIHLINVECLLCARHSCLALKIQF